jgi:hypothetical protein
MKVEEQVALLQNKKIGIGVGTPARLMELIDNGKYLAACHFDFHSNHSRKKHNWACSRLTSGRFIVVGQAAAPGR